MSSTFARAAAALCVCFAFATGLARAEDHKIELKPVAEPTEYWLRTIDASTRASFATTPTTGFDKWHEIDTLELVRQRSKPGEPGFLEVIVEPRGKTVRIDGGKVAAPDKREPISYRITTRNEMPDAMVLGDIAAGLAPTFPEKPVPVGHTWTAELKPTERFPFPYTVKHTFKKLETFQGEEAAVIKTAGDATNKNDKLAVALRVNSETIIGLKSGLLLRSDSLTAFNVQAVKRFKDGHRIQKRVIHRIVERRVKNAKEPAKPSAAPSK